MKKNRTYSLKIDVFSNYVTQIINMVLRFFLIPIYVSKLGVSAFGIIGFYFSIESIMVLLDFGMGVACAKLLAEKLAKEPKMTVRIVRSVEIIYLAISMAIGIIIFALSSYISGAWLTIDDPMIDGKRIMMLMAFLLAVGWPKSLYENFLLGQKKVVQKNVINVTLNIIRSLAMIYFITDQNGAIFAYFFVMIISVFIEVFLLRVIAFRHLSKFKPIWEKKILKPFFRFTSGIGVMSILSLVIFQADRVFISKYLSISELGIYNLSAVIPLAMFSLIYPITSATFPRLVNIESSVDSREAYKNWSAVLAILCIGFFVLLIHNLDEIANLWLGDQSGTMNVLIAQVLLVGVFCHSFTNMSTNLLLANGKSKAVSNIYIVTAVGYLLILFFSGRKDLEFIAYSWLFCNSLLTVSVAVALFVNYRARFGEWMSILLKSGLVLAINLSAYWVMQNSLSLALNQEIFVSFLIVSISLLLVFKDTLKWVLTGKNIS